MFDRHTCHSREMLDEVVTKCGLQVLNPPVRKSVRFAEAPARSRCILQHAPESPGADAYRALALQLDLAAGGAPNLPVPLRPAGEAFRQVAPIAVSP